MKKFYLTKTQIIRLCITLPLLIIFIWYCFSHIYIYPKIELWRDSNRINTTLIKIEDGYNFAQVPYSEEKTDNGYNIIIHLINKE